MNYDPLFALVEGGLLKQQHRFRFPLPHFRDPSMDGVSNPHHCAVRPSMLYDDTHGILCGRRPLFSLWLREKCFEIKL